MEIFDSSSAGNYDSLYHYTTRLLGIPSTDTTTMSVAEFTNYLNVWLRNTGEAIWKAQNYWRFDDNNQTDFAEATTDLVDGQQDYSLETTVYDVFSVTVKDADGNYHRLKPLTYEQGGEAEQEFYETAGLPLYYKLKGNSVLLFPKPDEDEVTLTDGLVLEVRRDIVPIVFNSATSLAQEPGIPRQFHDLLGIGIASDKALSLGLNDKWQQLSLMLNNKNKELREHYSLRQKDLKARIRPVPHSGGL